MSRKNRRGKRKGIFDIFREKAEKIIEDVADEVKKQRENQQKTDDSVSDTDDSTYIDYPQPHVIADEDMPVVPTPKPKVSPTVEEVTTNQTEEDDDDDPEFDDFDIDLPDLDDILGDDKDEEDLYDDLQTQVPRNPVTPVEKEEKPKETPKKNFDITHQISNRLNKMKLRYLERHSALIMNHRETYLEMVARHREEEEALLERQEQEEEAIARQHEKELKKTKDMISEHLTVSGQVTKNDLKQVRVILRGGRKPLKNRRRGRVRIHKNKKDS